MALRVALGMALGVALGMALGVALDMALGVALDMACGRSTGHGLWAIGHSCDATAGAIGRAAGGNLLEMVLGMVARHTRGGFEGGLVIILYCFLVSQFSVIGNGVTTGVTTAAVAAGGLGAAGGVALYMAPGMPWHTRGCVLRWIGLWSYWSYTLWVIGMCGTLAFWSHNLPHVLPQVERLVERLVEQVERVVEQVVERLELLIE